MWIPSEGMVISLPKVMMLFTELQASSSAVKLNRDRIRRRNPNRSLSLIELYKSTKLNTSSQSSSCH
jgi:hypothetical protein